MTDQLSIEERQELPQALLWLKDAPLFIDANRLADFYDAIVRPPHKEGPTIIKLTEQSKKSLEASLGAKIGASLSKWLSALADAKAEITVSGSGKVEDGKAKEASITLEPITTPQRQLEQLAIFYLVKYPDRLFLVEEMSAPDWRDEAVISRAPRELAFLNVPPGSIVIPTAAEFDDGRVVTFFDQMCAEDGRRPPAYPSKRNSPETFATARKEYWQWYVKNFEPQQAIKLIENAAAEHGRICWIDFRMPMESEGDTIHLHMSAAGKYETGVFAYYLVRRAYEYGLRLVGTLKSEPDMNVLAVYER